MTSRDGGWPYRCADAPLLRAAAHADLALPAWPELNDHSPGQVERWCGWLRQVWANDGIATAIELASPGLARAVEVACAAALPEPRRVRRMVLSTARYLARMTGRATPFGLFAGVAPASFGPGAMVRWGEDHRGVARVDAGWLDKVIAGLEPCRPLLERLPLMASNVAFARGSRLVVPYQADARSKTAGGTGAWPVEVSLRYTAAVRLAVEAARSPIRGEHLAAKLAAEFPAVSKDKIVDLVADLVERRVLVSGLRAPSTVTDALGHLVDQLSAAGADDIAQVADTFDRLREIRADLAGHRNAPTAAAARRIRMEASGRMAALRVWERPPVAVDLLMDCTVVLPWEVAQEVQSAASALVRLARYPSSPPAWQSFHIRFFETYGIGSHVPLLEVVDADVGLGFPAGYPGDGARGQEEPASHSTRDERLLALAQEAALDGRQEIVLDDGLLGELAVQDPTRMRVPPHVELCFQLHAESRAAMDGGAFQLAIVSTARAAGTMTGRFLETFTGAQREPLSSVLAELPVNDPAALPVQLSFAAPDPRGAQVTRVPELLPAVVGLGEHREPSDSVIPLSDLAVTSDGRRLSLISLSRGRPVEPTMLHALDLRAHTPPLARFLTEIVRSQAAIVSDVDWGAAARLPFLPRLVYRRAVLSPARWRLNAAALPGHGASWPAWDDALAAWKVRRRLPDHVSVGNGDRKLHLDLREAAHRALLRDHLDRVKVASLTEAPAPEAYGWFGGRAHEIVVPLIAASPTGRATLPRAAPPRPRMFNRDQDHLPGASPWLYAKLYGHPARQTEVLGEHLPALLATWNETPPWWFIRYRDPDGQWHLRLRIALADAAEFGSAAHRVSVWTGRLRSLGLLRDIQFATYRPEVGRWGDGARMAAAEEVFAADSQALVAQFGVANRPSASALAAAHIVAIAAGFTGSLDGGMSWLVRHARPSSPATPSRDLLTEAVRLADPGDGWAMLRAAPGGAMIVDGWQRRDRALAGYRALLAEIGDTDPDAVLIALLHAHHIRAIGIDPDEERTCLHLARAAALSWTARTNATVPAGRSGT
ncbi:lantibiotic dehydratase [Frankia gtarii]|uniref:lantibiotic dehydratase n=1 Tax=Frankia gtarii TaxID=2950102 RepID=UPI0021BEC45D|nr:lantibiotic dehydratase [Frankia gtarii]